MAKQTSLVERIRENPTAPTFKLKYGLICDQVRQEQNGKYFLIGVYGSEVLFDVFPTDFVFSVFCSFAVDGPSKFEASMEFRVLLDGVESAKGEGKVEYKRLFPTGDNDMVLSLPPLFVRLEKRCRAEIQIRWNEGHWLDVSRINANLKGELRPIDPPS